MQGPFESFPALADHRLSKGPIGMATHVRSERSTRQAPCPLLEHLLPLLERFARVLHDCPPRHTDLSLRQTDSETGETCAFLHLLFKRTAR